MAYKILILSFDDRGIMHYAVDLANSLSRKSKNLKVFFLGYREAAEFLNNNIEFIAADKKVFYGNYKKLKTIIKDNNIDIVHFSGFHPFYYQYNQYLIKNKIPSILTIHDAKRRTDKLGNRIIFILKNIKSFTLVNKFTLGLFIKSVTSRIVLSHYVGGQVNALYRQDCFAIPLAQDSSRYNLNISEVKNESVIEKRNSLKLLFFGSIDFYKGIDVLMRACSILHEKGCSFHLTVAGRVLGGYKVSIPEIIGSNVTLIDRYIDESEIKNLFLSTDIVVLPYTEISQSGVLPLAMSFGKPVIASDIGSFSELIEDGCNGYLFPVSSYESLAEILIKICIDKSIISILSSGALQFYHNRLNWDIASRKYLQIYRYSKSIVAKEKLEANTF